MLAKAPGKIIGYTRIQRLILTFQDVDMPHIFKFGRTVLKYKNPPRYIVYLITEG